MADERTGRRRRIRHLGTHVEGAPVGSLLLQVVRAHAQLGTRLLRREGVVPPQEIVLLHLDEQGPVAQADLVHYLGRDRPTVTNTLQAMERAGLIERTPSPTDRRENLPAQRVKFLGSVDLLVRCGRFKAEFERSRRPA